MILLVLIVLLTAELPDPGMPYFAPLVGGIGYFVGGLLAEIRRVSADERSRWTGTGMWAGIGIGGAIWAVVYAMDRL
jgi:hypothetical protein